VSRWDPEGKRKCPPGQDVEWNEAMYRVDCLLAIAINGMLILFPAETVSTASRNTFMSKIRKYAPIKPVIGMEIQPKKTSVSFWRHKY